MADESSEQEDLHSSIIPVENIERTILLIRGEKVILDVDLAALYGVSTKRLNQQVNRNPARFPGDFMFQLTNEERSQVVTICNHLGNLKYSSTLPRAFSEHGAIMAASVLNTPRAVEMSVFVVRAFVRLRNFLAAHPARCPRATRQAPHRISRRGRRIRRIGGSKVADVETALGRKVARE